MTVAPDLFNGTPAPMDLNNPAFNTSQFIANHGVEVIDPIIASAIKYLRNTVKVKKIAVTGYCFGGKYAVRFVAAGKGADVAFAAHPSLLDNKELQAVTGPTAIAAAGKSRIHLSPFCVSRNVMSDLSTNIPFAERDGMMSPARRNEIADLLSKTGLAYQVSLYGYTDHGFGVRANISDPRQKFAKEAAFAQAVSWFSSWA